VEYFFRTTKEANAQARQLFERAIALDPRYADAYALLGSTHWLDWDHYWNRTPQTLAQALALTQKAIALDDALPLAHIALSIVLSQGQPEQAIAEAERAIALDPNNAGGHFALGMILNFAGRPAEALEVIKKAIRLDPHDPFLNVWNLGRAYRLLGRYEEAIAAQKQVLLRNPNFLPAHGDLAESYWALWDSLQSQDPQVLERALESAQKMVALSDSLPWGHNILARVYLRKMQYEQAIAEAERAIALEPNNVGHYAMLAESRLAQWDRMQMQDPQVLERALESAQKMVALSDSLPWGHNILARVYLSKMQHAQALAEAERIIILAPNEADGYALRAAILNYAGQPEQAIEMMGQALRLNPQPPAWYLYHLGQAYRLTGRVEEAITTLKRALTQDPNLWDTYYDLAVLYSEGGQEEEARATVAELRRRAPHVSLEVLKQPLPYKDPAVNERMFAALRKAGLE
jgi:tetratricopeptide (TPR) repeat protein